MIQFRKIQQCDLESVFLLLQQLTEIDYSTRNIQNCWDNFIQNNSSNSIVGLLDNKIIAYGSIIIENKIRGELAGHIEDIVVCKSMRNKGIGIKLINELVKILNKHRNAYYNLNKPIISDSEYDSLFDELSTLEKETNYII